MLCTPCTVVLASPARLKRTSVLTADASDAHDTVTSCVGSLPHVRWICSGVPSGAVLAARTVDQRLPAAVARLDAPASFKNPRRETVAAWSVGEVFAVFLFDMSGVFVRWWTNANAYTGRTIRHGPRVQCWTRA
jgi:hypothetical protein